MRSRPGLRRKLTLTGRRKLMGYLFTLPFTIGLVLFIMVPLYRSVVFSLSELHITAQGYDLSFVGLANYQFALQVHTTFVRELTESTGMMVTNVFWVLVFSFFAATILNQEFRGRTLARLVFFLPVIMSAGIILRLEQQDYILGLLEAGAGVLESGSGQEGSFLTGAALEMYFRQLQVPEVLMEIVVAAVDRIPEIINGSGIQILIFLAGLQSISPSLYEAAEVEGAAGWEIFWLITLPLISPLILTAVIYTIVDFFTMPANTVVDLIRTTTFHGAGFGIGTAMSWVYFAVIALILLMAFAISSRVVVYQD